MYQAVLRCLTVSSCIAFTSSLLAQTGALPVQVWNVTTTDTGTQPPLILAANQEFVAAGVSSSTDREDLVDSPGPGGGQRFEKAPTGRERGRIPRDPNYGHIGGALSIGVNGFTGDLALPISRFFDLRLGASGFRFDHTFQVDTYTVDGNLQFAYGKAQLDYYPQAGHFRISPMLMFANFSHAIATIDFPAGKAFDFEDGSYTSSPTDPAHGLGRIDFRHTAPGLTIGLNNFTRGYGRWTFPVEIGAVYVGKPTLQLNFAGSICNNAGCEDVGNDPSFQANLQSARNDADKQLQRYARFLPVLNFGVGYRF